MRVLMTADTVEEMWTYACELIKALAPHGVNVTLATMGAPPSRNQIQTIAELQNAELASSTFALEWMPHPWRDVDAAGGWLLELAQREAFDVVHLNGYAHAALPFGIPVVSVAHTCVATWFRAVYGLPAPSEWDEYRRRVRAGLQRANVVVASTRAILDDVLAAYGVETTSRVIPNGCDAGAWKPGSKEPFVFAAGRLWDEAKGLADLDACAARVSWPIYVAGPTSGPAGIGSVRTQGVRMLGELLPRALAEWMGRASIYALPARYEPFGLSVVQGALSGAALVLGRIPALEEVWGDAACYVTPGDLDELAVTLEGLTADPLRRRALAAAGRSRALQLTPQRMASSYLELYRELAVPSDAEVCA